MAKIIADIREPKSMLKELYKRDVEVDVKQLVIADFVIETKKLNGEILKIGVERKTQNDFLNSIVDKRILNQLSLLRENFDSALLILEGSENIYSLRNFHPNSIRGMLTTIAIDFQVPIIPSMGPGDTASILEIIAKRIDKSSKPISLLDRRKPLSLKEMQEYLIESLPGIGPTLAKNLLNEFGNARNIANASIDELIKVEKIGKLKALKIKEVFESKYI